MRRLLAPLLLSLALSASALADNRDFARALEEWRALYRPLVSARGTQLREAIATIDRLDDERFKAVGRALDHSSVLRPLERREEVVEANLADIAAAYVHGDVRDRRAIVRLAIQLGSSFAGDVPRYLTCGSGPLTMTEGANNLLLDWFEEDAATYLGLLSDPDPVMAEAAVRFFHRRYADEVIPRLESWQWHPQARFRGIALHWSPLLGEKASQKIFLQSLEDPSDDLRDYAVANMPYEEITELYRLRRPAFVSATDAQRRTLLVMASRLDAPDKFGLAVGCLESKDASLLRLAFDTLHATWEDEVATVPLATLARLRKHREVDIRQAAYKQSGLQTVPVRDLRAGLSDAEKLVRAEAFSACCAGVETVEEFRFLLDHGGKRGLTSSLPASAARLGERAVDPILPFLEAPEADRRKLGVQMACRVVSPRLQVALDKILNDPDWKVRETLARESVYLPGQIARRWIEGLVNDGNEEVRKAAKWRMNDLDQRAAEGE